MSLEGVKYNNKKKKKKTILRLEMHQSWALVPPAVPVNSTAAGHGGATVAIQMVIGCVGVTVWGYMGCPSVAKCLQTSIVSK